MYSIICDGVGSNIIGMKLNLSTGFKTVNVPYLAFKLFICFRVKINTANVVQVQWICVLTCPKLNPPLCVVCGLPVVGPWFEPPPKNEEIELTRPELWAGFGEASFLWLRLENDEFKFIHCKLWM